MKKQQHLDVFAAEEAHHKSVPKYGGCCVNADSFVLGFRILGLTPPCADANLREQHFSRALP